MFKNKVVLITEGTTSVGAATAEQFAKEGATIAIVGKNKFKLKDVVEICPQYGVKAYAIKANLDIDEEADTIVKKTINMFGKIDILVHNSAINKEKYITADNFLDVFNEVSNVNVRNITRITRHALPYIIKSYGRIVRVLSTDWYNKQKIKFIEYRASKSVVNQLIKCCSAKIEYYDMRLNSANNPGFLITNVFKDMNISKGSNNIIVHRTLKHVSECVEIASLIVHMASDKMKSVIRANYVVDNCFLL